MDFIINLGFALAVIALVARNHFQLKAFWKNISKNKAQRGEPSGFKFNNHS
jgi:hypothetical protein